MKVIGIDVGLKGGIAKVWYENDRIQVVVVDMPVLQGYRKKEIDEEKIKEILMEAKMEGFEVVYIEKQQPFPKQGVVSTGKLMEQYGILRGLMCGLGISYREVRPQIWKRWFGVKGKRDSIIQAQKIVGKVIEKDGQAEAILIGIYGMESRGGF